MIYPDMNTRAMLHRNRLPIYNLDDTWRDEKIRDTVMKEFLNTSTFSRTLVQTKALQWRFLLSCVRSCGSREGPELCSMTSLCTMPTSTSSVSSSEEMSIAQDLCPCVHSSKSTKHHACQYLCNQYHHVYVSSNPVPSTERCLIIFLMTVHDLLISVHRIVMLMIDD